MPHLVPRFSDIPSLHLVKFYSDWDMQLRELITLTITATDSITIGVNTLDVSTIEHVQERQMHEFWSSPNVIIKNKSFFSH